MKVEIELPKLKGYEYTGEYRQAEEGDLFLNGKGEVTACSSLGTEYCYPILKPLPWRADHGKEFWFISSDLTVSSTNELDCWFDTQHYKAGNYYKSEGEAKAMADKFKEMLKCSKP